MPPSGRHVALLKWVPDRLPSGIQNQALARSNAIAEHFGIEVELLMVAPLPHPAAVVESRLRESGVIGHGVRLVSMWEDLAELAPRSWRGYDTRQLPDGRYTDTELPSGISVRFWDPLISRTSVVPGPVSVHRTTRRGSVRHLGTWPSVWSLYRFWLEGRYGSEQVNLIADLPELAAFAVNGAPRNWAITYVNHGSFRGRRPGWMNLAPKRGYLHTRLDDVDAAVYLTAAEQQDVVAQFGVHHTWTIPNIVRPSGAAPRDRDPHRGVMLARPAAAKRIDHAIAAATLVPEVQLDLYLLENRGGRLDVERERLVGLAEHVPNVTVHPGTSTVDEVLESAGFLLCTSKSEGFGLSLVEAQRAGCVPISYPVRYGPLEIIDPDVTGIRAAAETPESLAVAIRRYLHDPEAMRPACRAAAARYAPERIAPLWGTVLEQARARADRQPRRRLSHRALAGEHRRALDWIHPAGRKGPRYR